MSNLPNIPLATGSVELAGQTVEYRALSAAEAMKLGSNGTSEHAGDFIIAHALDISEEEAGKWLDSVPLDTATQLLTAIIELSGLQEEVRVGPKA